MIEYEEFASLNKKEDPNNPFSVLYFYESGESFYIEPIFYTQLKGFKERYPNEYIRIIEKMEQLVKKNKKIVFTGNFDFPLTRADNYLFLEITDVTNPLKIYVEDKSRGSDYGD